MMDGEWTLHRHYGARMEATAAGCFHCPAQNREGRNSVKWCHYYFLMQTSCVTVRAAWDSKFQACRCIYFCVEYTCSSFHDLLRSMFISSSERNEYIFLHPPRPLKVKAELISNGRMNKMKPMKEKRRQFIKCCLLFITFFHVRPR